MQKAILVAGLWLVVACPALAVERTAIHVDCETVRAFVAQVGLQQARAVALAHGMTASQERVARRCLRD